MKICRMGILGAGRIGKLHAENIYYRLPQFSLAAIADPFIDHDWAETLQIAQVTANAEEVINNPDIDAVLIASPTTLHQQQVIAASEAGKAIFCEKPLGLSEEEILICLAVVEKHKTLLQIGFNRRFDPNFSSIRARILGGAIGSPNLVHITSRDPMCPPRDYCKTSGGMFMDMSIHDFDMARFLIGAEVTEVFAQGSVLIHPYFSEFNDIDTAVVQLRFANGALAVIDNSRQAVYGYDQRVEVTGERGALFGKHRLQNTVTLMTQHETIAANPLYFFLQRYQTAFVSELNAFYHAWSTGGSSPVSGQDGLQAVLIAAAANQSLHTHQPVRLN